MTPRRTGRKPPKLSKRRRTVRAIAKAAGRKRGARIQTPRTGTAKRPPPSALAVRHVAFEGLGNFEPVLRARGFRIAYREAGTDDLSKADALKPDLLVMLGGPIGADEDGAYPFLADEPRLIEARLAAGLPVIGICLGAQLMARVLGARVYAGDKEIGWGGIELTEKGARSPLKHLAPDKTQVLHWHGDTFDLPAGTAHLAATRTCRNQAFSVGRHALALQFHAEATDQIEPWLIGHAHEIAAAGLEPRELREATKRQAPALQKQGPKMLAAWLDAAGLATHIKHAARK